VKIADFDYQLPKELIAQEPAFERSESRLLVLNRETGAIVHKKFSNIVEILGPRDVIVLNDTKVIPARLEARKATGGKVDILLTEEITENKWYCLVTGVKRRNAQSKVTIGEIDAVLYEDSPFWMVEFPDGLNIRAIMEKWGRMPLPHYIRRDQHNSSTVDVERYQTFYAQHEGSIAAPTAGLHFDRAILQKLDSIGVQIVYVTLHIGVGTFFLIKSEDVESHLMHKEHYTISPDCYHRIAEAKANGGRVVAVGTSAVRTLETAWAGEGKPVLSGYTGLYIYPGYRFKVVDGLVTNFHLPRSTPLMLVTAFAGSEAIRKAYSQAIANSYRFYSYGDAMYIS
jgi:S-adenosylmethionine:tRNA ribosyltransferase-isomerase